MYEHDRRNYQRGGHFHVDARVSADGQHWAEAHISDLSSGGLQLHTEEQYQTGSTLWFDLVIHGFLTEFDVKTKGVIKREILREGEHVFGVAFLDLPPDIRIRIDENVINDRPVGGSPYLLD